MDRYRYFQPPSSVPPKSNTERQRAFRERNPGYYQRLHAKRRAELKAYKEAKLAASQVKVAQRVPLMLPAPVEVIELPGINMISNELPAREAVLVEVRRAEPVMTVARFFEM